jgi:LPXTG-site transpeptidase (sortase) family protein
MKLPNIQTLLEQFALVFASFVWTVVVLTGVALFWAYQDVQARWDYVLSAPPGALAQANLPPTRTPIPTATVWSPPPTLTPSPTKPPTPTATWVIPPPNLLPETFNPDEPTPVPVVVNVDDGAAAPGLVQPTTAPKAAPSTATPTSVPTATPELPTPVIEATPRQYPLPTPTSTATPQPAQPPVPADNPPAAAAGSEPTRLVIPSVGIDSKVIPIGWQVVEQNGQQYSLWQVADYAVGWHETSALPGKIGNTVMAGHHNVNGEVFRDLVNVEVGDKIAVYSGNQEFDYQVELKTIVKEKGEPLEVRQRNAQWIAPTNDERLTLVTCWPYTNNTHRVIVVAKPM